MEALTLDFERNLPGFSLQVKLSFGRGVHVLFGRSGMGKTQTLECIAGLKQPDRGRIVLHGRELFKRIPGEKPVDVKARHRAIGYVFQDGALFPHMSLLENVLYPLRKRSKPDHQRAARLLAEMGLEHLARRFPHEVSGGQKRRTAVARALASEPTLLLMDEPFVHLDRTVQSKLVSDLLSTVREHDLTLLLVTHDLEVAARMADTISVLDDGKILQTGPKESVLFQPVTGEVARLFGDVNILHGRVVGEVEGMWEIQTRNLVWKVPYLGNLESGQPVELVARTGAVKIVKPGLEIPFILTLNLHEVSVSRIDRRPDFFLVSFRLDEGFELVGRIPADTFERSGLRQGAVCRIAVSIEGLSIFPVSSVPAQWH